MTATVLQGDCLALLASMPADSVDCVMTSPPYWGLRNYGVADAIGLEPTLAEHIAALVAVFRQVRRVLKSTGTCWINYGDAYATGTTSPRGATTTKGAHVPAGWAERCQSERAGTPAGLKTKDRMGLPHRLVFALQDDGWWWRDEIVWHKPNPMPSSVKDRSTPAHEFLFLLTKRPVYFFDQEAWKEPATTDQARESKKRGEFNGKTEAMPGRNAFRAVTPTRNKRSVWTIPPKPFREAHFATFPPALVEPCILAGCPERVCAECGKPWERVVEKTFVPQQDVSIEKGVRGANDQKPLDASNHRQGYPRGTTNVETLGFHPTCKCDAPTRPGSMLDPFGGAGTVGLVAQQHGRDCTLIELNPDYVAIAERRLSLSDIPVSELPLFAEPPGMPLFAEAQEIA